MRRLLKMKWIVFKELGSELNQSVFIMFTLLNFENNDNGKAVINIDPNSTIPDNF